MLSDMFSNQQQAEIVEPMSLVGLEEVFVSSDDQPAIKGVSSDDHGSTSTIPFPATGLKLSEAAERFNVTVRTVQRWIKEGRLRACKVEGSHGPEWRVMGESSDDKQQSPPMINASYDEATVIDFAAEADEEASAVPAGLSSESIDRMASIIEKLSEQLESARKDLQGASYRNGYLEAQLSARNEHIKLLTDSQHRGGWWARFCSWMMGQSHG